MFFLDAEAAHAHDGPMPQLRPAFAYLEKEVGAYLTDTLASHRKMIFERHLTLPIEL
jgi:hypothetical protein